MNITVVLGPFLSIPPEHCGAVEKLWLNLCREFANSGEKVQLVVRSDGFSPARKEDFDLLPVPSFSRSGARLRDSAADLLYSVRAVRRAGPADVTVVNSFWLPVIAPMRPGLGRIVYNVQRGPKRHFPIYQGVDLFVAVSTDARDRLVEIAPHFSSKTIVIGNAVDTDLFRISSETVPDRLLYVGRVHPEKGLALLIRAMRDVVRQRPAAELRIVGPVSPAEGGGGDSYLRLLSDEAKGLPITFHPPIYNDADLAAELGRAALFVYPSMSERGETFGLAVLEAMACGVIPVVSSLACFRDFVRHGSSGFVFDHRASDAGVRLAGRIVEALSMPDDARRQMRSACRHEASQFTLGSIARQYLHAFRKLVS